MGDIEEGAGRKLLVATLGYSIVSRIRSISLLMLDVQVVMVAFWIIGKAGFEAVVASGLSAVGADLANKESIFNETCRLRLFLRLQ